MHSPRYKHLLFRSFHLLLFLSFFYVTFAQGNDRPAPLRAPLNRVYVIAHRGVHNSIPENTLAAYSKAIEIGCDFVEIDARTTKDGKIISMHNPSVDEYVRDVSGKVSEMTFKEIRALDIGSRVGPQWKGARVPSFEEILKLCKGKIGIYLDLKQASVEELINVIRKHKMEREVVWYIPSYRTTEILQLLSECPECIVMPDPGEEENLENVIERIKPEVIATDMNTLSQSFISTAHDKGALVFADENEGNIAEWTRMTGWKVDGIQTDEPQQLIEFLKNLINMEMDSMK